MKSTFKRSIVISATIAAVIGSSQVSATAAPPPQYTGLDAVVSMGDSYIAGNAGRWLGNSNNPFGNRSGTDRGTGAYLGSGGCYRSDMAEIKSAHLRVDGNEAEAINLACSGSESTNIWRSVNGGKTNNGELPQADQLAKVAREKYVGTIVLSVGGNDLGFGDILGACMAAFMSPVGGNCYGPQQAKVNAKIDTAMANVDKSVKEIKAVMSDIGYKDRGAFNSYHMVLQSYPSPLPRSSEMRYAEDGIFAAGRTYQGCPMHNADLDWARDSLGPQIANRLRQVAAANGIDFLDLGDALKGHEACSKGTRVVSSDNPASSATSDWARFFNTGTFQGDLADSLHPNAFGQQALGVCLNRWYNNRAGTVGGNSYKCTAPPSGQDHTNMSFERVS